MLRRWAWAVIALGLVVMTWAGLRANRYRPSWFDPDDGPPCASVTAGCPPDLEAALRGLWWWVGVGGALVLIGIALVAWRLSPGPRERPGGTAFAQAAATGLVGGLVGLLLVPLVLVTVFSGPHLIAAGVTIAWVVQAEVAAGLDRAFGSPRVSLRRAWLVSVVASAAAIVAGIAFFVSFFASGAPVAPWWIHALVDGVVLALGVAVGRLPGGPVPLDPPPPGAASPASDPGRVVVAVLMVLTVVAVLSGLQALGRPAWPTSPSAFPRPDPPSTAQLPVAPDAGATPSVPVPAPALPPPVVEAAVPCAQEDLRFAVTGFDAAMGARGASLQATNVGTAPCWVEGTPVVTLLQGGRPLTLTVAPGQAPTGGPALAQRVGIAPGGRALASLTWRTYAGWADDETPQTVTAALDASSAAVDVPVLSPYGPAPFDIADGGTWAIAPWVPPAD